jgi:hypothetical protein
MLLWSIQISVISIILIFLVHHLIVFFKNTLTIPKIKDLVNGPIQKYENMYEIIHSSSKTSKNMNTPIDTLGGETNGTPIHTLDELIPKNTLHERPLNNTPNIPIPNSELKSMKDELKTFLKKQMNTDSINSSNNNIPNIDSSFSFNNNENYSLY